MAVIMNKAINIFKAYPPPYISKRLISLILSNHLSMINSHYIKTLLHVWSVQSFPIHKFSYRALVYIVLKCFYPIYC